MITVPLALLAYDTGRVIFNPPLLKRVLADEVVNSDLISLAWNGSLIGWGTGADDSTASNLICLPNEAKTSRYAQSLDNASIWYYD